MFPPLQEINPFSFAPLTKEEKKSIIKSKKEIEDATKVILDTAAECLSSDLFARYREAYIKGERELIQSGINLSLTNPAAYGFVAQDIFCSLRILRKLGDMINKDGRVKP